MGSSNTESSFHERSQSCSRAEVSPSASSPLADVPCDFAISITSPGGGWSNLQVAPNLHVPVFK